MARAAGTTQPVISAYERGRRDPGCETLARLLAATGARLELGLAPEGSSGLPPAQGAREHADRLVQVLLLAEAFPPRERPRAVPPRLRSTR